MKIHSLISKTPLALLALFAGCSFELCSSPGRAGRVNYSYSSGICLVGCPAHTPVLLGSQETMTANAQDANGLITTSASPSILSVTRIDATQQCCIPTDAGTSCAAVTTADACHSQGGHVQTRETFSIVANATGNVDLATHDNAGLSVDSIGMRVEAATGFKVTSNVSGQSSTTLNDTLSVTSAGDPDLTVALVESSGVALIATDSIQVTLDDTASAQIQARGMASASATVSSGQVITLHRLASGATNLHLAGGGQTRVIHVTVQ